MTARNTFTWTRAALTLVSVSLALLIVSCSARKQDPAKPAKTSAESAAGSKSSAPAAGAATKAGQEGEGAGGATCTQIDIGEHEYLGDLDFDPATGTATLTVLGHATGNPFPHAKADATLNVVLDSGTAQVKFPANPAEGDPEGKTSRYRVTDPSLKGVKALKGRVNLTIDGKTFLCDLQKTH